MGATSVTGVGLGSAEGGKGPGNGRNQFVPLVSPHVIAAGTATRASDGTIIVTFPEVLSGSETGYVVMLTSETNNLPRVSAKTDVSGNFSSFTVSSASEAAGDVMWCVIKAGNS